MSHEYKPGSPYGRPVDPKRCKASVSESGRSLWYNQCSRKPWKDGWCKQHHPDTTAARRAQAQERYETKHRNSPSVQLRRANAEIVQLKERVAELEQIHNVPSNCRVMIVPLGGHDVEEFYKEDTSCLN